MVLDHAGFDARQLQQALCQHLHSRQLCQSPVDQGAALGTVVLVYGPRQCGKSTLVQAICPTWTRIDLERPADLGLLQSDLEGFLHDHPRRLAIDEAQVLPELFPALRHAVDAGRGAGRYVLTGSASPSLIRSVSESLAGRVGLLELTPFRAVELTRGALRKGRWFWAPRWQTNS